MVLDLEGSDLGRLGTGSLSTMKFRCCKQRLWLQPGDCNSFPLLFSMMCCQGRAMKIKLPFLHAGLQRSLGLQREISSQSFSRTVWGRVGDKPWRKSPAPFHCHSRLSPSPSASFGNRGPLSLEQTKKLREIGKDQTGTTSFSFFFNILPVLYCEDITQLT